ncbi:hypothetical protein COCON_G00069780 [Conger conger]|uniref:Hydantoinase/oxoprolinase N-terminal domain-containing protein n=1 Tax=Conger conger TaxID=82655 RepID=A0A9Q1DT48_CONCO|nr:hypothetical protein COCON_G00069780 [Conger conger]
MLSGVPATFPPLYSAYRIIIHTRWDLDFEPMAETKGKFDFAIDRGGTFTDVFARCPDGREKVLKLLSHDPQNYKDAPTEGIRRVLEEETGRAFPVSSRWTPP